MKRDLWIIRMDGQFMGEYYSYEEAVRELEDMGYKKGAENTGTWYSENGIAKAELIYKGHM